MPPAADDASRRHDSAPPLHVLGALALELRGDAPVARTTLAQAEAGELGAHMARDLATFAPDAAQLQLVTVGAHYDPVELLRPGWALHRELDQLSARAPGDASGRIIAFGAPPKGTSSGAHDGQLPGALAPSPDHLGGPFRLVPFVLGGDAAIVARVGDRFERELSARGRAGAATALAAQAAFGIEIEHARYLTAHDLAAMTALQYEHAGLAPLWPVLETALLDPDGEAWLDAPPEPLLHYAGGEARIALFEPRAWKQRYATDAPCDTTEGRARLERQHEHFLARQRQIAAVLGAHGVPVNFVHCTEGDDVGVLD
jgi:hypothetical protein